MKGEHELMVVDELEPIRLKFGGSGPAQQVTNERVKQLKAHEQVTALDGTAYAGNTKTGHLEVKGGSERVQRRRQGLSARQWKKQQKAKRRPPVDDLGNPEPHDLGERDLGEHGE